jgi:hypothetical protein
MRLNPKLNAPRKHDAEGEPGAQNRGRDQHKENYAQEDEYLFDGKSRLAFSLC